MWPKLSFNDVQPFMSLHYFSTSSISLKLQRFNYSKPFKSVNCFSTSPKSMIQLLEAVQPVKSPFDDFDQFSANYETQHSTELMKIVDLNQRPHLT